MRKRAALILDFSNLNRFCLRNPGTLLALALLSLASSPPAVLGEEKKAAPQPAAATSAPRTIAGLGPLEPVGSASPAPAVPVELRRAIREYRTQIQRITLDSHGPIWGTF